MPLRIAERSVTGWFGAHFGYYVFQQPNVPTAEEQQAGGRCPRPTRLSKWGASMPAQRSRSRIRVWSAVAVVLGVIAVFVIVVASALPGASLPTRRPSPPPQVSLQSSIVNDREHLFNGVLTYEPPSPMPVDNTQLLEVQLIAVGQDPSAVRIPYGHIVGSRSLRVGGVEDATLSARGGGVQISSVGPTRRLIGQPGDMVSWTWEITPMQPGMYTLELVVVTYQGESDNPLSIVNPPIPITLNVTDTLSHRVNSVKGWIIGFSAFLAAVAIILTFFREQVFGLLPKRKKKEKEQKEQSAPTPE
jgi:hypothetical protein